MIEDERGGKLGSLIFAAHPLSVSILRSQLPAAKGLTSTDYSADNVPRHTVAEKPRSSA